MNKVLKSLLMTAFFTATTQADMVYYTFEGNASRITYHDNYYDGTDYSKNVNDPVKYIFGIDLERQGSAEGYWSGSLQPWNFIEDENTDYFYTEFKGNYILPDPPFYDYYITYNFGYSTISNKHTILYGGFYSPNICLESYSLVNEWQIGQSFDATESAEYNQEYRYMESYTRVILTDISTQLPDPNTPPQTVPEPAILGLIGLSLLSLGAISLGRKR
jgi:hypothetical protein